MLYCVLEQHFQSLEVFHISFSEIYAVEYVESEKREKGIKKRVDDTI